MKIQKTKTGDELHWKFIAETLQEKKILSELRGYYFWGFKKNGTFPKYDGREDDEKGQYVQAIMFKCKTFNSHGKE